MMGKNPITRRDFIKKTAKAAAGTPFVMTAVPFITKGSTTAEELKDKMSRDNLLQPARRQYIFPPAPAAGKWLSG